MDIEFEGSPELDDLLSGKVSKKARVIRVADLSGFDSVEGNILVRKSEQDLWRLNGDGTIERLFDDTSPVKG